jgi:hypothetical protein
MSRVVRIDVSGLLDGATTAVYTAPAIKDENGIFVLTVDGDAGLFPLRDLLANLPGGETPDQFFPRVEFTANDVAPPLSPQLIAALGPELAPGVIRSMTDRAYEDLFVASTGGLLLSSEGTTGPHRVYLNMCDLQTAEELIAAACCLVGVPDPVGPPFAE